jgi:hypothetical protein
MLYAVIGEPNFSGEIQSIRTVSRWKVVIGAAGLAGS